MVSCFWPGFGLQIVLNLVIIHGICIVELESNQANFLKVESKSGRILYGRLKRAPKLPSKPALQSSESSTDDLSGSEDSSSDDIGLDFVFYVFSQSSQILSHEKNWHKDN